MSDCQPSDDVRRIIRAMARAKVEEGFTDANAIVDEIHSAISEHTPLWKNEIADIITGIGQPKRKATQTELQERLTQLKRDLKATYHPKPSPKTPDEKANATQQTRLRNQIADIQGQINRRDFSKPDKRSPLYDEATQKLQLDLAAAKREADKLMAKIQRANRSLPRKIVDTMGEWYRASILLHLTVFEHLSGASIGRFISAPLEQIAGGLIHHTPGFRGLSEGAPTEGGGFQGKALIEGYKSIFSGETGKAMKDKLVRGYSDRQALYDKHADYDGAFLSAVGHSHDVVKTPVEQFAFYKALTTINSQMRKQLAREGKSPDEIDAEMKNEYSQARNGALAYARSKADKLQGENWLTDLIQNAIRTIGSKGPAGAVVGGVARLQMPIIKIPTNYAKEVGEYAYGLVNAMATIAHEQYKLPKDKKNQKFTPEVNDNIMRNLKKGLVGQALATIAWLLASELGALYDKARKKKPSEPEYGDIRTPAGEISHHWLHIPFIEYMQAVVLARRVWEQQNGKIDKKTGIPKPASEAAGDAALHAAVAVGNTLPFVSAGKDFANGIRDSSSFGDYTGRLATGFIPGAIQDFARGNDPDSAPRKPHGFIQQIEQGIPGLRENVPHKTLKGMSLDAKLDLYDKMSPREREESGISDSIDMTARHLGSKLTEEQVKRLDAIQ